MTSRDRKLNRKGPAIQYSDPGQLLNLLVSLDNDSSKELESKINTYLVEECDAEIAFMIVVDEKRKEAYIQTVGDIMLPRKIKISESKQLNDVMESGKPKVDFIISIGNDIQEKIQPFLKDPVAKKFAIMLPNHGVPFSALVCVIGAKCAEETSTGIIHECMLFCWPTLSKCAAYEFERSLKQNCQILLRVARNLFTKVASLETLMKIAMEQAKRLTKAEYCFVLVIDVERMELHEVFTNEGNNSNDRRFPMNIGLPGQVLKTGYLVNVKTVEDCEFYNSDIDCPAGVKCKSLLSFPIRDQSGIIGVGQLVNKIGDPFFDAMDEEMAMGFSIYCGISIIHSMVYEKLQEAHARNTLANELIMYHLQVADADIQRTLNCKGFHGHLHLSSWYFNIHMLPPRELPCYVLRMFKDLGFDQKFQMRPQKIVRFILQVKQGYRDVPFHNFMHSFTVAQFAYSCILEAKLVANGFLNDLQCLMYFLASLMHDLDHRGTTNSYQIQGQTALAALYSSEGSVMERHHLSQALCILNADGCDILESLPRRDYDRALIMLRDYILATDIANFFKNVRDYNMITEVYQKGNRVHTAALQALLMNAADLSDEIKEWDCVKKSTVAVVSEFFSQGDDEKSRGVHPTTMMDREKCIIPELELNFIKTVCMPVYQNLARLIPKLVPAIAIMESHMERWEAAIPVFAEVPILGGFTVLQSQELDDLIEFNIQEKKRLLKEAEEQRLREEEERQAEIRKAEEKAAAKKARN